MCGFAGYHHGSSCEEESGRQILSRMGQSIHHRGPDQGGIWLDSATGTGLAARRLAIIDLSQAGDQPMVSPTGRFVLSYNGEIYNHLDLRRELESAGKAPEWRGSSDTETLLAGVEAWGLAATLQRAVGMFALAIWDQQDRRLCLARDRLGEKPLYYGHQGQGSKSVFLFGSELKALACHPAFEGTIDRDSVAAYMREGYVPAPRSIYRGISKLSPGSILTLDNGLEEPRTDTYWSPDETIRNGISNRLQVGVSEAVEELELALGRAVAGQLISDVPIGAFLSGGIDSSAIVALMQRACSKPIQTFTIGFEDPRFDEAPFARKVAEHLGTDHHELVVSPDDALAVVPRLPAIYDEPFADSSQVPTFLISQLARTSVTVALSGDGGDELFAGYERYLHAQKIWKRIRHIPRPVRAAGGSLIRSVPRHAWTGLARLAKIERPHSTFGDQVHKGASVLGARSPADLGIALAERWHGDALVIGGTSPPGPPPIQTENIVEALMASDMQQYLPDDILVKVDRAAMAVSLETRAPYLDHRVVELAWKLPLDLKLRQGRTKWILRKLLARLLPERLFDRPKRGFSIPVDEWLRGPLRDWAEELLSPSRLQDRGYVRPGPVQQAWRAHLDRRSNRQAQLWTILMFEAWLESVSAGQVDKGPAEVSSNRLGGDDR